MLDAPRSVDVGTQPLVNSKTNMIVENGISTDVKEIMQLPGGKGVDVHENSAKRPFRCGHRFALVCRKAVKVPASKPLAPAKVGNMLVQTCRLCGCFRASMFSFRIVNGQIRMESSIKFVDSGAGLKTLQFGFVETEG